MTTLISHLHCTSMGHVQMLRLLETFHSREVTFTLSPSKTTGQQPIPPPHATVELKGRVLTLLLHPTARGKGCDSSLDLHIWPCNPRSRIHLLLCVLKKVHTIVIPFKSLCSSPISGPKSVVIFITCFVTPKVLLC